MRPLIDLCVSIASMLWFVVIIDQWLTSNALFGIYGRIGLILSVAATATIVFYRWRCRQLAKRLPVMAPSQNMSDTPPPSQQLRRELALAIQHLESIGVLLDISDGHQQPVPRAVPANVKLVLKHLRNAARQVHTDTQMNLSDHTPEALCSSTLPAAPTRTTRTF